MEVLEEFRKKLPGKLRQEFQQELFIEVLEDLLMKPGKAVLKEILKDVPCPKEIPENALESLEKVFL